MITGAQTESVWVNPSNWYGSYPLLIGTGMGCNNCGVALIDQGGGSMRFQVSNATNHASVPFALPPSNSWELITAEYDGSNVATVYVNGVPVNTVSSGLGPVSWSGTSGNYIGVSPSVPSFGSIDGLIDDVRIYNRALSAAEIQAMYNGGK
jgi:hypothetical protein